jgi:Trypsin-like serine proteases, typically periplasmic, contain C-terminal PDZ domain
MTETPNEPTGAPEPTEPTPSEPIASSEQNLPGSETAATPVSGDAARQPQSEPAQNDTNPTEELPRNDVASPDQQPTENYGAGAFGQPQQGRPQQGQPNPYAASAPAPGGQPSGAAYPGQQSPYAAQNPYAAQQQYPQPHYVGQPGQQYAQQPGQHVAFGAHQQTAQLPRTDEQNDKSARKRGAGLVIAGLAIGAIIGGASGAGVMGIVQATQPQSSPAASTGAGNITVNNASDATVVTAVAAKASPSVVTISVNSTSSQESGTGSGVILSSDGYVLTNTHVVTLDGQIANPTITVTDNNGKIYTAKVVGTDPIVDLAVIKVNGASGMKPATFADSTKLNVGDKAVAIGAPLGLSGTVTDGIVSALNRSIQIASSAAPSSGDQQQQGNGGNNFWNFDLPGQGGSSQNQSSSSFISLPVVQTDAAINPGNSGGALLNAKGEVIGINVAIASAGQSTTSTDQSGSIGVGFAIPSDLAQRVAGQLIKDGKATHGLLGATVKDASTVKAATTVGAEIASVTPNGAAAKAGLQAGDIVTNFNGVPITNPTDLTAQVRYLPAGGKADVTYQRDGRSRTTSVTLGTLSSNS